MKRWVLASCAALCAFSGQAEAEDNGFRRLTVELDWKHLPRTSGDDAPVSSQGAAVKGGVVRYLKYRDGSRLFGISYDNGFECTTIGSKSAVIMLSCGSSTAYYYLVQSPGKQTRLEWVWVEGAAPAAEKKAEPPPAPKAKVRL